MKRERGMKTTAAVTFGQGDPFEVVEIELDEPQVGEVRIRMVGSGVCHTDALGGRP